MVHVSCAIWEQNVRKNFPRYKEANYAKNVCATIGEYEGIKDKNKIARIPKFPKKRKLILEESGNVLGVTSRPVKGADI